jgi:hypothetical protein
MSNSNVPRGDSQSYEAKKAILRDFVSAYQPNIHLSTDHTLSMCVFDVAINVNIDDCLVFLITNTLCIRWMKGQNFIVIFIDA